MGLLSAPAELARLWDTHESISNDCYRWREPDPCPGGGEDVYGFGVPCRGPAQSLYSSASILLSALATTFLKTSRSSSGIFRMPVVKMSPKLSSMS